MKIKIALILDVLNLGGTERSAIGICKYINNTKFSTELIFLNKPRKYLDRLEGIKFSVQTPKKVIEYLNSNKFDIVLSYSNLLDTKYLEAKLIQSVIFSEQYSEENDLNLMSSMTEYIKIKHILKKEPKNSEVLYLQLDDKLWEQNKTKKPFYKPNNNITLGRLARKEPSKWHWLMLATLLKLKKIGKINEYNFIFMGFPEPYKLFINIFFRKQIKNKTIQIFDETSDQKLISQFFNSIDVFIQTSWFGESFGCVITESFFHKKPVITDWKGFLNNNKKVSLNKYDTQIEVVDFETGYYVKHPNEFATTIIKLTKKELTKKGQQGFEKTKKQYFAEKVVHNFEQIILNNFFNEQKKTSPSKEEIKQYEKEYLKKIKQLKQNYTLINYSDKFKYQVESKMWRILEYFTSGIRKINRRIQK